MTIQTAKELAIEKKESEEGAWLGELRQVKPRKEKRNAFLLTACRSSPA
jgi:hypothetical protein